MGRGEPQARGSSGNTEESRPPLVEEMEGFTGSISSVRRTQQPWCHGPSGGQLTDQDPGDVTDSQSRASEKRGAHRQWAPFCSHKRGGQGLTESFVTSPRSCPIILVWSHLPNSLSGPLSLISPQASGKGDKSRKRKGSLP